MREIKFRGKRVDNGEWVVGDLVTNHCYGVSIVTDIYHVDGSEYNVEDYQVIPETVGQFTGLHDKNGKEIYEGDIFKNPDYEEVFFVEYHEGVAGYVGWGDDKIAGCYLITDDDIEVIGNIHDNPEMIK